MPPSAATKRASSTTAARRIARRSTSESISTSRPFATSRPAKSCRTTTRTSVTAPRMRTPSVCTCASAARPPVAGRSSPRRRSAGRAARGDRPVTARHDTRESGAGLAVLLRDAIDYAGLFPPAQLDMPGAVAEYAAYLRSADAWALGRFGEPLGATPGRGLSAVFGADVRGDVDRVIAFNAAHEADADRWWGRVEAVELRAATVDAVRDAARTVP